MTVDGRFDEPAWSSAEVSAGFKQADPNEGAAATSETRLRVIASPRGLHIAIDCDDPEPSRIVSYSKQRDASLTSEDHVRIVLDTFLDGRSGYVFAVNPNGARYDALVEPGGETDNPNWDGIWEAATRRTDRGWMIEVFIPIETVAFKPGLREWHLNVERRVQRLLETDRWSAPSRQFRVTQTSRAGLITGLPQFSTGLGLTIRPAITTGGGVPAPAAAVEGEFEPSIDVTKRLGANVLASFTANTDFAETDVDTRRTNLTRFPLFFPEKRSFFLEGADVFSFGLGLNQDVVPYFSRRIGLVGGREIPLIAGSKVNGRAGQTNFGALIAGTGSEEHLGLDNTLMAVGRVKQNLWRESWVGGLVTLGDPLARSGAWLTGADFTYATSHFRGDKNFLVGVWGLVMDRDGLGADRTSHGFKIDYPNDLWDIALTYKRIGRDFDPSIGFVPRAGVHLLNGQINNITRIGHGPLQRLRHEFEPSLAMDLHGKWESYRVFMAPINWRFRTGDRFEFNANPTGERLTVPTDIAGVTVAPGAYHWMRYRLEVGTAQKRRLYAQTTWWFGGFYDGRLDQFIWTGAWNPMSLLTLEFSGERDLGRDLTAGDFTTTVSGLRARVNLSSDLNISSYVQYDTTSKSVGVNSRLRWTFNPAGDLFVVYNHNIRDQLDRWQLESNQLLVKLQYAVRR